MRIKKVSGTSVTQAQVVDGYSTSTTDSYSCNYVNNTIKNKTESGYVASSAMTSTTIGGTASRTYDLTFTNTYSTPPTVIVSIYHNAELSNFGFVQCAVNNITSTGCKLLFANNMSNNNYGINYLVISND